MDLCLVIFVVYAFNIYGFNKLPVDAQPCEESTMKSSCSVSCGTGTRRITTLCCFDIPGVECLEFRNITESCSGLPIVHGGWGSWGSYSLCTKTCGTGNKKTRTRTCTNPSPTQCGNGCSGMSSQTTNCNTHCCPVNGNWGPWGGWSPCSVTCGQGTHRKYRACNSPAPSCGGYNCLGSSFGSKECNVPPIHGGWGAWGQYSSCSRTCGTGSQSRTRICNNPSPENCGNTCSGGSQQTIDCHTNCCPVNGNWGLWEEWSPCSETCGQGARSRNRDCDNPVPSCRGSNCIGNNTVTTECSVQQVHGDWSSWGQYSQCTKTCGNGTQTRSRSCNSPSPANCGDACRGNSSQTTDCNTACCPVGGNWGHWTDLSQCSVSCGQGTLERERECNNPAPICGGQFCIGDYLDRAECYIQPVNGSWGQWSQYGACSKTCGNGTHTRTRECSDPLPTNCGWDCAGYATETSYCNILECLAAVNDKANNDLTVTYVWPNYGPKAGGTAITVHGSYFPAGSVIVIGQDIYCETVWVNDSNVFGVTPILTSTQTDTIDKMIPITILADSSRRFSTANAFMYKANPLITNVYPLETIITGGTHLTVQGDYLNSVAEITMETTMILRDLVSLKPLLYSPTVTKYETACTTLNRSSIICPTPTFDLPPEFTFGSNRSKRDIQKRVNQKIMSNVKSRSKREVKIKFSSDGDILEFYIGFNMDGVDDYKNYSSLDVFEEPEFQLDGDVKEYTIGERLFFEGTHLDVGVTEHDYNITIGAEICGNIQLASNALSCLPPETEPDMAIANEYNHPRIMIRVGINIEHMAGYLRYPAGPLPLYVIILSAVIPACVVLIIVVTVSVVCVQKRNASSAATNDKAKTCNDKNKNVDNIS